MRWEYSANKNYFLILGKEVCSCAVSFHAMIWNHEREAVCEVWTSCDTVDDNNSLVFISGSVTDAKKEAEKLVREFLDQPLET
jgi:hypothetical protein